MCLEAPGRLEFPAPFFLPSQNRILNSLRRFESCGIYLALIDRESTVEKGDIGFVTVVFMGNYG